MGAGTSAEEFFLKSINVESIFEFVERTDYLFLYSIKECVEKSDCHDCLLYTSPSPRDTR